MDAARDVEVAKKEYMKRFAALPREKQTRHLVFITRWLLDMAQGKDPAKEAEKRIFGQ